jgi:hypothetical protein
VTRAVVDHGGSSPAPYGGYREHYRGQVEVDRATFEQRATARVTFALDLPEGPVRVSSDLDVRADPETFRVRIELSAHEGEQPVMSRSWSRVYPRDLA